MRISCVQMDMRFADPERNFEHADELIRKAAQTGTDVIVLPETWNTGFFPKENLPELSDCDGQCVRQRIGSLHKTDVLILFHALGTALLPMIRLICLHLWESIASIQQGTVSADSLWMEFRAG